MLSVCAIFLGEYWGVSRLGMSRGSQKKWDGGEDREDRDDGDDWDESD